MLQVCQSFSVVSKEKASSLFLEKRFLILKNKEYKINISR